MPITVPLPSCKDTRPLASEHQSSLDLGVDNRLNRPWSPAGWAGATRLKNPTGSGSASNERYPALDPSAMRTRCGRELTPD